MQTTLALCGLSAIISTTLAQSTSHEQFDQVLLPMLTQCEIHVMSHRCVGSDTVFGAFWNNKIDQELEEAAFKMLSARGLPYRHTILPCNKTWESLHQQVHDVAKGRNCQTTTWFLGPVQEHHQWLDIRFSWLSYNKNYSSEDLVLLVFREGLQKAPIIYNLDHHPEFQPENILLIALNPGSLTVKQMGVVHRHCNQKGIIVNCVKWAKPTHLPSITGMADRRALFCNFAPRSIYSSCLIQNLNKIPLIVNKRLCVYDENFQDLIGLARRTGLREILFGVKEQFHRNERDHASIYVILTQPYVYYQIVAAVELYEELLNVSIQCPPMHNPSLYRRIHTTIPTLVQHTNLGTKGSYDRYFVRSQARNIGCVSQLANQLDVSSILNPLDMWVWASLFFSYLLLGVILFRHSQSTFFILLAPIFSQTSGLHVKRFSFLILMWTFLSLLVNNLYASFIGSFLVVPPPIQSVESFEELYKNGYKLVLSIIDGLSENETKRLYMRLLTGRTDLESPEVLEKYKYLFKLEEKTVIWRYGDYGDKLDFLTQHGKGCLLDDGLLSQEQFQAIVESGFPEYTAFFVKEKLSRLISNWFLTGPYRTVLQRGLSLFFAAGLTHVYDSGEDVATLYYRKLPMEALIRRTNPYYLEGVFYQVGIQERLHLFSLKNEQSRLVFYVWGGLVAMSVIASLVVNRERIWRKFRKCIKRFYQVVTRATEETEEQRHDNENEVEEPELAELN